MTMLFPSPTTTTRTTTRPGTQQGKLAKGGWLTTRCWSRCWVCNRPTHLRKPGAVQDTWLCQSCDVQWDTPTRGPVAVTVQAKSENKEES